MRKKLASAIAALCIAAAAFAVLCACSAGASDAAAPPSPAPESHAVTPAPTPTPVPTPEPTPPPPLEATLTGSGPEEILKLMDVENLVYVDATASTCYPELMRLRAAKPECVIDYVVDFGGIAVSGADEYADIQGIEIPVEELKEKLQYLPELKKLNMCSLGYKNEESLEIVGAYPDIDIVWTVNFGAGSVRSDIQVYSTLHASTEEARYATDAFLPLFEYCTDLVALDLGHNGLIDLEPLTNLKKLKVLILGDNPYLDDITPLGELTELEYLEMFRAYHVKDYSPLNNLTKMTDLNLCYCLDLEDLSFLDCMPELKTFWCRASGITYSSPETCQEYIDKYPDVKFVFYAGGRVSSFSNGWRATERNVAIREAFTNWRYVEVFNGWDDVKYVEGANITEAKPQTWW